MPMNEIKHLTDLILPYLGILISLIMALMIKDIAMNFSKGLMFTFNKNFNPGDRVMIDDQEAIIISIGIGWTVFEILPKNGKKKWRYLQNSRIPFVKLEKII